MTSENLGGYPIRVSAELRPPGIEDARPLLVTESFIQLTCPSDYDIEDVMLRT
jgi:hypothetical protein